ncbi:MAG TPA: S8 family serine peptidase [Thermoanaerobaculia bacterium]|jgi:subtilisin family serine protease
MRKFVFLTVAVCLAVAPAAFAGDWLVLFKGEGVPAGFAASVAALGGTVTSSHDAGIAAVSGLDDAAAAQLGRDSNVAEIQPDAILSLPSESVAASEQAYISDPSIDSPSNPAAAFFFPRQWHLRAVGANIGWAAGRRGSAGVTVAICDTGIDYLHPDLQGRVDLARSKSFIPSDDALAAVLFPTRNPITDLHFHGTHVAATVSSNALAAAGMTSGVTLIGVKVLGRTGSGPFSAIFNGMLWAADHGADVINMSLGTDFPRAHNGQFRGFYNRIFNYVERKGTLIVVAAGNDAIDLDHDGNNFNANCNAPNVVCVSATGPTAAAGVNGPWTNVDAPAFYTNYGRSAINVAAPGGNSGGAVWEACSSSTTVSSLLVCRTGTFVVGLLGTSMATPHVAGLAALVVENVGHNKPSQVKAVLQQTADDLGQPGTDPFYGKGRINVPRAEGLQ